MIQRPYIILSYNLYKNIYKTLYSLNVLSGDNVTVGPSFLRDNRVPLLPSSSECGPWWCCLPLFVTWDSRHPRPQSPVPLLTTWGLALAVGMSTPWSRQDLGKWSRARGQPFGQDCFVEYIPLLCWLISSPTSPLGVVQIVSFNLQILLWLGSPNIWYYLSRSPSPVHGDKQPVSFGICNGQWENEHICPSSLFYFPTPRMHLRTKDMLFSWLATHLS